VNAARAGLGAVASVEEVPGRRFQRFGPQQQPAGLAIAVGRRQQPGTVMAEQAAAVQRVRLPVRDVRSGGELCGAVGEDVAGGQVAGLGGEADGIRQQVLDVPEFFRAAVERVGQRGEGLRQRAVVLEIQAAGQGKGANDPGAEPEPFGVGGGRREVTARGTDLAAVEADHGGDAELVAGRGGFLQVFRHAAHLGQRIVPFRIGTG